MMLKPPPGSDSRSIQTCLPLSSRTRPTDSFGGSSAIGLSTLRRTVTPSWSTSVPSVSSVAGDWCTGPEGDSSSLGPGDVSEAADGSSPRV